MADRAAGSRADRTYVAAHRGEHGQSASSANRAVEVPLTEVGEQYDDEFSGVLRPTGEFQGRPGGRADEMPTNRPSSRARSRAIPERLHSRR